MLTGSEELRIGDVTVVAEQQGEFVRRVTREIAGAARVWNHDDPRPYAPPHSLLVVREISEDPDPYQVAERLSRQVERFLMLARLLTAGTVQSRRRPWTPGRSMTYARGSWGAGSRRGRST